MSTGVPYDPDAKALRWGEFLDEIFSGDQELIAYVKRAIGYSLTGQTTEQKFFICFGSGANGKTTFFNSLHHVFGDYAKNTPATTLLADPRGHRTQSNDLAALKGVRFVTASEISEGVKLDEGRVKAGTGGDLITARFLFGEYNTYKPKFKWFLSVNHRPTIKGTDEAIWRRIHLIPFTAHFPDGRADKALPDKLTEESPGILSWIVEGTLQWKEQGLVCPAPVREATGSYRREMDLLGHFLEACTIAIPGAKIRASELYRTFKEWCSENGHQPINNLKFGKLLSERGIRREKHGYVFYTDLGLLADQGEGMEDQDGFPSFFSQQK